MPITVLYSENVYGDDRVEREVYGPDVRVILPGSTKSLADLPDADCAVADGLMLLRYRLSATALARFPKLRAVCRMGIGYDGIDRKAAAERQVLVPNVPDYGTTEVADHAIALALALRRGLMLHLDAQRRDPPAVWPYVRDPLVKRMGVQTFGIGTAVALRAKAFGCRVVFFDPNLPNGAELGLGIGRARTLEQLLSETDTLSVHAPLTPERRDGVFVLEIDLDQMFA
jgi:phosphoglycerate dehydrogenase-like enzyme